MSVKHLFRCGTGDDVTDVLNVMKERSEYRNVLFDLREELNSEILPKLVGMQRRLHAGSDAMRDEGDRLMHIVDNLELILNGGGE